MTSRRTLSRLVVLSSALVIVGCSSAGSTGSPRAAQAGSGSPSAATMTDCPTPASHPQTFPGGTSSELPHPAFATSPALLPVMTPGVTLLRFTTQMSLRDAVIFVLRRYPAAGYHVGQGDAEKAEADVPFVNGTLHGTTRLSKVGACTTTWLVQTVKPTGASPGSGASLPPDTDSASPPSSDDG